MTWYAVYREADGSLVSEGSVLGDLQAGWAYKQYAERPTGRRWDPAQLDYVAAPARTVLTRRDFLRRFTRQERIAIRRSDDDVVIDFRELLDAGAEVELEHPETQAGVQYLEAAGLIGAGRAAEVLDSGE